jgi:hypothetical protein
VSLDGGWATFVTGIVYLDRAQLDRAGPQLGGAAKRAAELRAVVLHEFGHLIGLAHVTDPMSIMFLESALQVSDYYAGDRRGIHAVSAGTAHPTSEPG